MTLSVGHAAVRRGAKNISPAETSTILLPCSIKRRQSFIAIGVRVLPIGACFVSSTTFLHPTNARRRNVVDGACDERRDELSPASNQPHHGEARRLRQASPGRQYRHVLKLHRLYRSSWRFSRIMLATRYIRCKFARVNSWPRFAASLQRALVIMKSCCGGRRAPTARWHYQWRRRQGVISPTGRWAAFAK